MFLGLPGLGLVHNYLFGGTTGIASGGDLFPGAFFAADFVGTNTVRLNGAVTDLDSTAGISITRATSAYYTDAQGQLSQFASGVPRLGNRGLLVEGAATNLVARSQEFDNASWQKLTGGVASAPTVTANYAEAPDGTLTADRVQFALNGGTASADRSYVLQNITISTATTYTFSFYAKSNGGSVAIGFGGDNIVGNTPATVTSEWQRFSVTATSSSTSTNLFIQLRGAQTPTQANSADLLIWGAQLEATAFATSYIPTTAGSATRNADVISIGSVTGLAYPVTALVELERAYDSGASAIALQIDDGDSTDRVLLEILAANDRIDAAMVAASVGQGSSNPSTALAVGTIYRVAARFATNSIIACVSGTLGSEDTSATVPATPTNIRLGSNHSGAGVVGGYIRRLAIFPTAYTNAQLQAITA